MNVRRVAAVLAAVRGRAQARVPISAEALEQFETDVLTGFVLARADFTTPPPATRPRDATAVAAGEGLLRWHQRNRP